VRVDVVTIFPEYLAPLRLSLIGRAVQAGLVGIGVHDLRGWTHDVHRTVDDSPYGGGPGMVMRPEPWGEALAELVPAGAAPGEPAALRSVAPRLVVPTPAGALFSQAWAAELAGADHLIFACGRYEGIDQRVLDEAAERCTVTELSIGDYVLFGGEVAVLVMLEAVVRLLPGVLGNAGSLTEESHVDGLLEAPVYTKPAVWRGREVPDALRSGDHRRIARWRREESLRRTAQRRPDLLAAARGRLSGADLGSLAGGGFSVPDPGVAEW
jgi:tRNA (guanine37-N1)-methyltransferase